MPVAGDPAGREFQVKVELLGETSVVDDDCNISKQGGQALLLPRQMVLQFR